MIPKSKGLLRATLSSAVAAAILSASAAVSWAEPGEPIRLHLSARATALPGLAGALAEVSEGEPVGLELGAPALCALAREEEIRSPDGSIRLVSAVGGDGRAAPGPAAVAPRDLAAAQPTHVLYRDTAHPIDGGALVVGTGVSESGILLASSCRSASAQHCTIFLDGSDVVIQDHSTAGTFVNDKRVDETAPLRVGDRIRLGDSGEELRLIAMKARREA